MRHDALYSTRGPRSSNASWRTVAAQSPAPGKLVAWHATVTITTSMQAYHAPGRAAPARALQGQVYAAMRKADLYFVTRGPEVQTAHGLSCVASRRRRGLVAWRSTVVVTTSLTKPTPKPVRKVVTTKPTPKPKRPRRPRRRAHEHDEHDVDDHHTTTYPGEDDHHHVLDEHRPRRCPWRRQRSSAPGPRLQGGRRHLVLLRPGRCATWYLPLGTRVTVRDLATEERWSVGPRTARVRTGIGSWTSPSPSSPG